ncbi:MAG TPA: glycine--tRNA ligase subunit beta [Terriglobales bacterium]|jgi:glycyl-tRNA synthetase beta chain|nr:glycine--tRNA ligase subunit beta [Terriglobales bacterium]
MPDFLLEIGCEEIPARMIDDAMQQLGARVGELLAREGLGLPAALRTFSTPRRLSLMASIAAGQSDVEEQVLGPSVKVAYKDGQPAPPAQAFAKKVGLSLDQIKRVDTPKGEYLSATVIKKGRFAREILADSLAKEIDDISWPKNMYWRKPAERFVRPVRWLVAMLDGEVVPVEFDGILAGKISRGHRIIGQERVEIPHATAYGEVLRSAKVLDAPERLAEIRKALDAATRTIPGARWREDKSLLDTVVNLTEYPSVILGKFDREFLELPDEVLVTVMRDHQKYFAVEDAGGKLLPHFLAVLNTDGDPRGIIQHGHERVLRARFNDARFFWQTDQKHPLRERGEWLKHVTFQKDLGSYYEKTLRVQRLCSWLSEGLRQSGMAIRPGVIHKAAYLAKTDLTTELVKEFTELQGIVGGLYARIQQLDDELPQGTRLAIADAIYDQYKPESMEDSVPRTVEGAMLSIGDKADSIAGMFALGMIPSGSKDPFALRRQANGIVKTIAEHRLPLQLTQVLSAAREAYRGWEAEKKFSDKIDFGAAVRDFFRERLEFYLRDVLGFKYDVVNAVLAAGSDDVVDTVARTQALTRVRPSADFESISVAFKRIKNILRQASETGKKVGLGIDADVLREAPEKDLAGLIPRTAKAVEELRQKHAYEPALIEISKLRPAVDTFFDKVMVMVEDEHVRANRLALLQTLLKEFSTIADFSEIVTEGK